MDSALNANTFGAVFGWAPLVIGIIIYFVVWMSKRHETGAAPAPIGATYACANCGKRGSKEHMVPQAHQGAVSYVCAHCSSH